MPKERPLSQENSSQIEETPPQEVSPTETSLPAVRETFSTLNELIDNQALQYGNYPATGMAFEEPLTYHQFHYRIICLARHMLSQGIKQGDRVALLAENSHNWGTAYLAIVRLGAIGVPILPDLPESDVKHIIIDQATTTIPKGGIYVSCETTNQCHYTQKCCYFSHDLSFPSPKK